MRLFSRTCSRVFIAPRAVAADGLGCECEAFSDERIPLRANIGNVNNTLNSNTNALLSRGYGMRITKVIMLRFAGDAPIEVGDGVVLPGEGAPKWRCVEVSRFPTVTCARLERMAAYEGSI